MNETLVTLKIAKLAKAKGFNVPTIWYYHPSYGLSETPFHENDEMENMNGPDWAKGYYSAPTQSLLQKWIREIHFIHSYIVPSGFLVKDSITDEKWSFCGTRDLTKNSSDNYWVRKEQDKIYEKKHFKSYEDALEIALLESLKLIPNETKKK